MTLGKKIVNDDYHFFLADEANGTLGETFQCYL